MKMPKSHVRTGVRGPKPALSRVKKRSESVLEFVRNHLDNDKNADIADSGTGLGHVLNGGQNSIPGPATLSSINILVDCCENGSFLGPLRGNFSLVRNTKSLV